MISNAKKLKKKNNKWKGAVRAEKRSKEKVYLFWMKI